MPSNHLVLCCPLLLLPSVFPSIRVLNQSTGGSSGKEPAFLCRRHKRLELEPWVGKIAWKRAWQPTPVSLPGESHGQRSLAGYSPWGHKELDMTETTWRAYTLNLKSGKSQGGSEGRDSEVQRRDPEGPELESSPSSLAKWS